MKNEENNMTDPPLEEIDPKVCDKNNPSDPHYADRDKGDYNATCVWIWDLGINSEEYK